MRAVVRILSPLLLLVLLAAFGGRAEETTPDAHVADDEPASADDEGDSPDDADEADEAAAVEGEGAITLASPGAKKQARAPRGGCPTEMVRVGEQTCMDRYEAPNRRSAKPLVMQSANDAETWCAARHKRLCSEDEWVQACEGAEKRPYPYGASHEEGRCNDDKTWRQVSESTLGKWPAEEAKEHTRELYQAASSGSKRQCKSQKGVYDLTGNVEEWVTRSQAHANGYHHLLIGCYWAGCYGGGKPTCHSTNSAHGPEFRFYETGFRCCKDPAAPRRRER